MHRRFINTVAMLMVMTLCLTGCTSEASNVGRAKDKKTMDTGFIASTAGSYDSADTAVVISTDQENSAVVFMNMETGKQYTLYYDGTTYVKDKHDGPMTISQIEPGNVVDVTFLKGKKRLASIQRSPQAWVYDGIENYDLGGPNKTANIGSNTYSLPDDVVVMSEGRRSEVMDVVKQDVLTVSGIDHKIYSINVEKGHGYLRLKNDQALIGGWIEVGNSVIREITEDMLLVVPEGSYQVLLSNSGVSGTKEVLIERNKEVILDVGDLEITENKTGRILFSVTPDTAKVSIDGQTVDISKAVELPYGIHQVHLEAKGYDSLTKYIQVGSEYATISFELEEERDDNDRRTVSSNTIDDYQPAVPVEDQNKDSLSENALGAKSGNRVYIDAPKNVEVYLDGNYIGVSPISFKKTVGSHTITLRKSGYKTKSYTIYLYNDGEDITYSFTDLEQETVSGNGTKPNGSVSDNSVAVQVNLDLEGVRVFVDDILMGITSSSSKSIDFNLKPGRHTITLMSTKYATKDYQINIPDNIKKITYTREDFPGFGETVSGNDPDPPKEDCEHEYEDGICTKCGKECSHDFSGEGEVTLEPTCTKAGEKTITCSECGESKTEEIPATGHHYEETSNVPPTCTDDGKKVSTCECGESKTEIIPATGHHFVDGKCEYCDEPEPESGTDEGEGENKDNPKEEGTDEDGQEEVEGENSTPPAPDNNTPQTSDSTVTNSVRIEQTSNSRRRR